MYDITVLVEELQKVLCFQNMCAIDVVVVETERSLLEELERKYEELRKIYPRYQRKGVL